jgi:hypothetical protein
LPVRFASDAVLVTPDPSTFYSPGAKGYTDFASLMDAVARTPRELA